MSGIYGYIKTNTRNSLIGAMTKESIDSLYLEKKSQYTDDNIDIAQVYLKKIERTSFEKENIVIFIDGFIYNLSEINIHLNKKFKDFFDLLFNAYKTNSLKKILSLVNGYFVALLYDKKTKKISLITDRWGLRFIYFYKKNDRFVFSESVKEILSLEFVDKELDLEAIDCFLNVSPHYFMGDNTYFKYIKLVRPSTILEYDPHNHVLTQEYYWSYSEIKPSNLSYSECIDKMHDLFLQSVKRRTDHVSVSDLYMGLSGGLDSRLCIAALNELNRTPKDVITLGDYYSADVIFARLICNKLNVNQAIALDNTDDWFSSRLKLLQTIHGILNTILVIS